jgi:hypothetical protein
VLPRAAIFQRLTQYKPSALAPSLGIIAFDVNAGPSGANRAPLWAPSTQRCVKVSSGGREGIRIASFGWRRFRLRTARPAYSTYSLVSGPIATLLFPAIPLASPCSLLQGEVLQLSTAQ